MAEPKTIPTRESVKNFLGRIADENRRKDCQSLVKLMSDVTGAKPEMWGTSIIGFGRYLYKYPSGREMEWMMTGFSPRKTDLTLYIMSGLDQQPELMKRLGKHKTGNACLYIKKLEDVDTQVLRELIERSISKISAQRIDKPRKAK